MKNHKEDLLASMVVWLAASPVFAATVAIEPADDNATPRVVAAVREMSDGDTLRFKKGEYRFFEEGAQVKALSLGATGWGEKKLVFGFEGRKNITIDGGGSTFVWHGNVFPFAFSKCRGVTVSNLTARVFRPSYVEFRIDRYLDDGGFEFTFNPGVAYSVRDGALRIETDLGTFDSRAKIMSAHALERMAIHYLFAANETTRRDNLPSTFFNGVSEDLGGGRVRIANRRQNLRGCLDRFPFRVGEPLCFLLNGRERCSLHFSECRDVTVKDVHLTGGDGMGIVSFLNENVTIDGYRVEPREGARVSITADCLFVVNNRGLVEVKNSTFSWALDDAINMHGNYLRVTAAKDRTLELEHIHRAYYNFAPYHPGDTVEFTDPDTRDVLLTARVVSAEPRADGARIVVDADVSKLGRGTLVEDLTWLPEVRLHDNVFHDVLHVRLSGRGKYTVERNVFRRGICLLVNDLAKYWGEAGRTGDMTIRDNLFDSFSARGWGGSFITVEVDGRNGRELKIHRGLRVTGNRVRGLPENVPFVNAPCALDPVIEGNVLEAKPKVSVFERHVVDMAKQRGISVDEAVRAVRSWGIGGADLWFGEEEKSGNARMLAGGLQAATLVVFMDLAHTNDIARTEAAIAYAKSVGSPRIMLVPGFVRQGEDRGAAWRSMLPNLRDFVRRAASAGLMVDIEDFDSSSVLVGSQEDLRRTFAACPQLGHVLDTGNYLFWTNDVLKAQREFAARIRHVHIKDRARDGTSGAVAAGTGVIPVREVVANLRAADYRGWITVEDFGSTNLWDDIRTSAAFIRRAWQEAAPKGAFAAMKPLPLGSITARGWLKDQLRRNRDGLGGHLDELEPQMMGTPYTTRESYRGWGASTPGWGAEISGNYWQGVVALAWTLDDAGLKAKATRWVEAVLKNAEPSGYLGTYKPTDNRFEDYNASNACGYLALLDFAEATGRQEVFDAVHRALVWFCENWAGDRKTRYAGVQLTVPMMRVYARTGDRRLLDFTLDYQRFLERKDLFQSSARALGGADFEYNSNHAVAYANWFSMPACIFLGTGERRYLEASRTAFEKLRRHALLPTGAISGNDEYLCAPRANAESEYCGFAGLAASYAQLLAATGDVRWGDRLEETVFNAAQGARKKDEKAIQYFSSPNMVFATEHSSHCHLEDNLFGPVQPVACCAARSVQVMPEFTRALAFAGADGALVLAAYAPCAIRFAGAVLECETRYPFEGTLRYTVRTATPVAFTVRPKKPSWCAAMRVTVNGREGEPLARTWRAGDVLELSFGMKPVVARFDDRSAVQPLVVKRGPLVFALPIREKWDNIGDGSASSCNGHAPTPLPKGWAWWRVTPVPDRKETPLYEAQGYARDLITWNVALDEKRLSITEEDTHATGYVWENPPVKLHLTGYKAPFAFPPYPGKTTDYQVPLQTVTRPLPVTLVPYGCTALRISCFPRCDAARLRPDLSFRP